MSIQQFMEALEYRLNDAWEHQWSSYTNGQAIGFYNDYASLTCVFNRENQEVIEISARSELEAKADYAYRWINPAYKEAIKAEAERRNIPYDEAGEDQSYTELEVIEDVLEKGAAMLKDEDFDTRIQIPLDMGEAELLKLFKAAHELDMTLNQYMEEVLKKVIAEEQPKNSAE